MTDKVTTMPDWRPQGSLSIYQGSTVHSSGTTYFLVRSGADDSKLLAVHGDTSGFQGTQLGAGEPLLCPLTPAHAAVLRGRLSWLSPVTLGLQTSAGFGDRLGLATPGHVRAIRRLPAAATSVAPIFAQQSVRENARTGRTPQQVLDDATWGLLEEGWCGPWGADADHLKTPAATEDFAAAGYTFFTVDPGDCVDDGAQVAAFSELEGKVRALPWDALEDSRQDLETRYLGNSYVVDGPAQVFDREMLWRAAAKYGAAVGHAAAMYRHIESRMENRPFELEVSVDETASTTSLAEHYYIATELRRLGVRWISLAPRFVGRFEKGVDYVGDLEIFSQQFAQHASLARELGPYKLSLHSGSDKFSIYSIAARLTTGGSAENPGSLVHLKTAGTSYLEALRTVSRVDGALFREILAYARECYEVDRATYHVSAQLEKVPGAEGLSDAELPDLLEQFDARQVLHVTFGSVLDRFGEPLRATLRRFEESHYSGLEAHFVRHLTPFVG